MRSRTRKRNNFGGISTVIVMALVIAVSIAIAVYFISYFLGLSSSVAGTAQSIYMVDTLSSSMLSVKNTGSVAIKELLIKLIPTAGGNPYCIYLAGSSIPAGASISVMCTVVKSSGGRGGGGGYNYECTITPKINDLTTKNDDIASDDPLYKFATDCSGHYIYTGGAASSNSVIEAGSYKIVVYTYYSNGKVEAKTLGTFSAS